MGDVDYDNRDQAREAIHYALNNDFTVLQFDRLDNGRLKIVEITEHVQQLERIVNNKDPAEPMDE